MKTRIYSLIAAFCLLGGAVGAQDFRDDPRYGDDPASREQNVRILNFFNDAYKAKEYGQATVYLRQLIENAPKATPNIYIRGVEIYKSKALGAQSLEERRTYVDSILWIFDKRIEAFGEHPQRGEAYLRGEKVKVFLTMMPADRERLFQLFREALHEKHPLNPGLAVTYFNSVVESYRLDDVTPEQVIDVYERLSQRTSSHRAGPPIAKPSKKSTGPNTKPIRKTGNWSKPFWHCFGGGTAPATSTSRCWKNSMPSIRGPMWRCSSLRSSRKNRNSGKRWNTCGSL